MKCLIIICITNMGKKKAPSKPGTAIIASTRKLFCSATNDRHKNKITKDGDELPISNDRITIVSTFFYMKVKMRS